MSTGQWIVGIGSEVASCGAAWGHSYKEGGPRRTFLHGSLVGASDNRFGIVVPCSCCSAHPPPFTSSPSSDPIDYPRSPHPAPTPGLPASTDPVLLFPESPGELLTSPTSKATTTVTRRTPAEAAAATCTSAVARQGGAWSVMLGPPKPPPLPQIHPYLRAPLLSRRGRWGPGVLSPNTPLLLFMRLYLRAPLSPYPSRRGRWGRGPVPSRSSTRGGRPRPTGRDASERRQRPATRGTGRATTTREVRGWRRQTARPRPGPCTA